jgi:DNA-binding NarL/FixJ family response regulator
MTIRVLIADDHPVVRDGLRALLDSMDDFEVVAVAEDGKSAVREAIATRPEVAVLDIQMPGLDGVAAARELARVVPDVAVLMLTMHERDASVLAAMRAGARGYLVKGASQEEIARAIATVAAGGVTFGAAIATKILGLASKAQQDPFPELTPRESEVLDLVAAGLRNPQIARRLGIAPKTVANALSGIFAKLQLADRSEAIDRARDAGLGQG